ncbi:MAG: hypothetical protein KDA72_17010, partial [Planctomycetales bacterium]|nr:hypothetical protein [Planctomycetales bacterium]
MTLKIEIAAKPIRTLLVVSCLLSAHRPATSQEPPSSTVPQAVIPQATVPQLPQLPQHTTLSVSPAQQRAELQSQSQQHWLDGELTPAIERLQQLIDLESSLFGDDSERLAQRYEALSNLYLEAGDVQQAESSIHRASQLLRANYPSTSWQAVEADRKQAVFKLWTAIPTTDRQAVFDLSREVNQHYAAQQLGDALTAAEKLAALIAKHVSDRHPAWIDVIASIETIHMAQGNLENVGPQLEKLYSLLEQVEHPDHPNFG